MAFGYFLASVVIERARLQPSEKKEMDSTTNFYVQLLIYTRRLAEGAVERAVLPLDLRALAVGRIVIGSVAVHESLQNFAGVQLWYGPQSLCQNNGSAGPLDLYTLLESSTWCLMALLGAQFAISVGFAMGSHTTLCSVGLWCFHISMQKHLWCCQNAGDKVARYVFFWQMFLPMGARWSLDVAQPRHEGIRCESLLRGKIASRAVSYLLVMEMCFIYYLGGARKRGPIWLTSFDAAHYAVWGDVSRSATAFLIRPFPGLLKVLTVLVKHLELYGWILLLVPIEQVRLIGVAAFAALHAGYWFFLDTGDFQYWMVAALIMMLPAIWWDWVELLVSRALSWGFLEDGNCATQVRSVRERWYPVQVSACMLPGFRPAPFRQYARQNELHPEGVCAKDRPIVEYVRLQTRRTFAKEEKAFDVSCRPLVFFMYARAALRSAINWAHRWAQSDARLPVLAAGAVFAWTLFFAHLGESCPSESSLHAGPLNGLCNWWKTPPICLWTLLQILHMENFHGNMFAKNVPNSKIGILIVGFPKRHGTPSISLWDGDFRFDGARFQYDLRPGHVAPALDYSQWRVRKFFNGGTIMGLSTCLHLRKYLCGDDAWRQHGHILESPIAGFGVMDVMQPILKPYANDTEMRQGGIPFLSKRCELLCNEGKEVQVDGHKMQTQTMFELEKVRYLEKAAERITYSAPLSEFGRVH